MIILRNKYFSNEDNKDNSKLKTRIIGGGIAAGAGGLGAYVGNKIGQATAVSGQEGEVYKKYKGNLSGINSAIEQEQQNLKNLRKDLHKKILRKGKLANEGIAELEKRLKPLYQKKNGKWRYEGADQIYDLEFKTGKKKLKNLHNAELRRTMIKGRQARDPIIFNLRNLKKDKGIVEKVLKDRKTRGKWGSAIGAASAAGLAGAAYLGIKNKNKNR